MQFTLPNNHRKLLLASAICTLFSNSSFAQATVNVEGLVDAGVGAIQMAGDAARTTSVISNGMSSSYLGFRGSEDLGGGVKAHFVLSAFLRPDTGEFGRYTGNETLFSRDAAVGLSGAFGQVMLGRGLAPNFLPAILFNPFADSFAFSPLMRHLNVTLFNASGWTSSQAGDTGWSNQIKYTTPNFSGLSANVHYQFGEKAGELGKKNVGANLLLFRGPLSLTAYYQNVKVNNPLDTTVGVVKTIARRAASKQQVWFVGGAYDFSSVKLFATFDRTSQDADFSDTTVSAGLSVPAGAGKFLAASARTERSAGGIADIRRITSTLGYDYSVSRRSDIYANLMRDTITGQQSGTSFGVGIRHRF